MTSVRTTKAYRVPVYAKGGKIGSLIVAATTTQEAVDLAAKFLEPHPDRFPTYRYADVRMCAVRSGEMIVTSC